MENKRTKERMTKSYGHNCTLSTKELENFFTFQDNSEKSLFNRIIQMIKKQFMICDDNMPTSKYCRSKYALQAEINYHMNTNPNLIHPLSNFRKWWEFFMIIIGLCMLTLGPFTTTFSLMPNISNVHTWQDYPRLFFDFLCVVDIILNFRTAYYDEQREINLNNKEIAQHYINRFFTFDVLSCLPPLYTTTNITIFEKDYRLFYANLGISLLKACRLMSVLNYINNYAQMRNIRNYYLKMTLIIITIVIIFHWLACICIVVNIVSVSLYFNYLPRRSSWITEDNVWNSTTSMMYATSLFRTACIVSNAENERSDNHADTILVMFLWVFSRIVYTAFVSLLIQITRSLTSSQTKYKEMVLQLMQYMHHKQLSSYTQNRLLSYYEFRFQKSFFREQEILNTISGQLRQEILMLKCLKLVENVPFFKGLPQSLLMRIVLSLQLEIFLINDVIIKAKTRGTSMYFIGSGTVATYTETGREIYHLHDGQHFGEIELVMAETLRISSVIAIEPCELYRLDRKDFIQIIKPYPELFSSIETIAAERLQYIRAIDEKHKHFYKAKHAARETMR